MPRRLDGQRRIIDANLNRAREAARVIEEHARFILGDSTLARKLKELRHALRGIARRFDGGGCLLAARDTPGDVGTRLTTLAEGDRATSGDVLSAAFKRLEEALRVIEEYAKLDAPEAATQAEALRYEAYALEAQLAAPRSKLRSAHLGVVLTTWNCSGRDPAEVACAAIRGGCRLLEMAEPKLHAAELLAAVRRLREVCVASDVLLVVAGRSDVAAAAEAHGVRLGSEDLPCCEVRRLFGAGFLIGVTAETPEAAQQAEDDGADYLCIAQETDGAWVDSISTLVRIPLYCGPENRRTEYVMAEAEVTAAQDVEAAARAMCPPSSDDEENKQ
jgi:thiamine-phosphate pyrophosphorylase